MNHKTFTTIRGMSINKKKREKAKPLYFCRIPLCHFAARTAFISFFLAGFIFFAYLCKVKTNRNYKPNI